MTSDPFIGPIDFAVFATPREADVSAALAQLRGQIQAGGMLLLDIEVVALDDQGAATRQSLQALPQSGLDLLAEFETSESDLFDDEDLADIAAELGPDELAIVLVYEDRSLATFAERLSERGGRLLWAGGVHTDEIEQALEHTKES